MPVGKVHVRRATVRALAGYLLGEHERAQQLWTAQRAAVSLRTSAAAGSAANAGLWRRQERTTEVEGRRERTERARVGRATAACSAYPWLRPGPWQGS